MINKNTIFITVVSMLLLFSCSREKSTSTGWNYNDRKQGGFDKKVFKEQTPAPGMVFVEGGRLTMGRVE